jgi:hypothetical protein
MKPRTYKILGDAVESGIRYGWNRGHKHTDQPDRDLLMAEIYNAVMYEIDQVFSFEDDFPALD